MRILRSVGSLHMLPTVIWAPEALGWSSSPAPQSTAHIACLAGLRDALLRSGCYPWRPSHGATISKLWGSLRHLNCVFITSLYWVLFRDSGPAPQCQMSTSPHDSFNPGASATTEASPELSPNFSLETPGPCRTVPRLGCFP